MGFRDGESDSAIAKIDTRSRAKGLAGRRQALIENGIPEHELKKNRKILHDFNVDGGKLCHKTIGGKPCHSNNRPQKDGDDDADKRDLDGIQGAYQQSADVGVCCRIGDQGLPDLKGSLFLEKTESCGNGLFLKIDDGV